METLELKPQLIRRLEIYLHEPVNCLTHALGALFSLFGMLLLLQASWGDPWRFVSFTLYGVSSVLLYLASSALHGLKVSKSQRRFLLKLDHVGIFSLIAGSYTPLALVVLKNHSPALGWTLFILVWTLAAAGMTAKLRWLDTHHWFSTSFYVLLGWLAVFALGPITQALPAGALALLVLGGLLYTGGAVIFGVQRPNFYPGVLEHHEIWHLFVLAGGFCHFLMFFLFVAPH